MISYRQADILDKLHPVTFVIQFQQITNKNLVQLNGIMFKNRRSPEGYDKMSYLRNIITNAWGPQKYEGRPFKYGGHEEITALFKIIQANPKIRDIHFMETPEKSLTIFEFEVTVQ